jgi:hypothetical protein
MRVRAVGSPPAKYRAARLSDPFRPLVYRQMLGSSPLVALILLLSSIDPTIAPRPTAPPVPPGPPTGPPPAVTRQGALDQQSVRYYIRLQEPAVRNCYLQEIGRQPNLKVAVAVVFTVESSGRVSACAPGSSALEKCVAKVVCAVRFPQVFDLLSDGSSQLGSGATQVRYRFKFQPTQKDKPAAAASQPARKASTARAVASQPARSPATQQVSPPSPPRAPGTRVPPSRHPTVPRPSGGDPLEGIQDGDLF